MADRTLILIRGATKSNGIELAEVIYAHNLGHIDRFHASLASFSGHLLHIVTSNACWLDKNQKAVVLEQVYISAGKVCLVIDFLMMHLSQMLIRFFVLIIYKSLWKLVHEVGGHAHDLGLIHWLFHATVVGGRIVDNVALYELILLLCLQVDWCFWHFRLRVLPCVLLLSELVTFADFGLFEQNTTKHAVFVEVCLHFLGLDWKQRLEEAWVGTAAGACDNFWLERVKSIDAGKGLRLAYACHNSLRFRETATINTRWVDLVEGRLSSIGCLMVHGQNWRD